MRILLCLFVCLILTSCAPYKPDLDETQVVNGESIIVPPDFNQLPKEN
ncbi:MAG: hypothetical protein II938_03915 [Alphaproteobacteria bacterium]|nr:hypothetical protein [Alphaproteobacteria bacterium]